MFNTLRDYTFVTVLGKGTFGTAYLVRRKKDSKPFVVKEQPLGAVNTLSFKIVQGEIQCLRRTRHPNIVDYRDAWIEGKHSYILMEYATRCTLKDLLTNRRVPLEEEDALYLFSQIVLGVHHIHYKNILHRDLKPENIMLTGHNGDIVKIGDFGVSETYGKLLNMSGMFRAGSLYYMAPEMVVGCPYDFKCDVWSLGVVLYEMITNNVPFPSKNLEDLVQSIGNEKPKWFRRNVSAPVINLVSKLLRKEAARRPKTDQLLLCPYLVPYVVRVHLNLGRTPCMFHSKRKNYSSKIFLNYLKPRVTGNTIPN